jgi:hypothetical protein
LDGVLERHKGAMSCESWVNYVILTLVSVTFSYDMSTIYVKELEGPTSGLRNIFVRVKAEPGEFRHISIWPSRNLHFPSLCLYDTGASLVQA